MSKIALGIDAGSTYKTECVAVDTATRKVLGRSSSQCANWHTVGRQAALDELWKSIQGCLETCGQSVADIGAICIGMAGMDYEEGTATEIVAALKPELPEAAEVIVYDDAVISLASGTGGQLHGCVVVVGSGTVTFGMADGKTQAKSAGWGPVFMDGGSGFDLANRGLSAMCKAYDGRGASTMLLEGIISHLKLTHPRDLLRWAYHDQDWSHIAALAPLVVDCATQGDAVADTILKHGVGELFRSIKAVVDKLQLARNGQAFKVVMTGALLQETSLYTQYLAEAVKDNFPTASAIHPDKEPAEAAALLACKRVKRA